MRGHEEATIDLMNAESQLRLELEIILDAIDAAPWRDFDGERAKRIYFAPLAIERIRGLLAQSEKR